MRQVQPQQQCNNQARRNGTGTAPRPPQTPTPMNNRPNQSGFNNQLGNRPPQQAPRPQNSDNNGNGNSNEKPFSLKPTSNTSTNGGAEVEGTPWLSARAIAKAGDDDALAAVAPSIKADHLFNPKAESPSIRKTPGVDHNSSKPIKNSRLNRPVGSVLTPSANAAASNNNNNNNNNSSSSSSTSAVNIASPATAVPGMTTRSGPNHVPSEPVRRIGAPPSAASPLANRNQFRPPPMKRGPPADTAGGTHRPPLADMPSNVSTTGGTAIAAGATGGAGAVGTDAKRQKIA